MSRLMAAVLGGACFCSAIPSTAGELYGECGSWSVFKNDNDCSIGTGFEGPREPLVLLTRFVDNDVWLTVTNPGWSAEPDEEYSVTFALNEETYRATSIGFRSKDRGGLRTKFEPEFLADFVLGDGLQMFLGGQEIRDFSLMGSATAIRKQADCVRSVWNGLSKKEQDQIRFAEVPIDPFQSSANTGGSTMPREPRGPVPRNPERWAARINNNYPREALRDGLQGRVGLHLNIGVSGRVTDCRVVSSSGHEVLDTAACSGVLRYARFQPAIGPDGEITTRVQTQSAA